MGKPMLLKDLGKISYYIVGKFTDIFYSVWNEILRTPNVIARTYKKFYFSSAVLLLYIKSKNSTRTILFIKFLWHKLILFYMEYYFQYMFLFHQVVILHSQYHSTDTQILLWDGFCKKYCVYHRGRPFWDSTDVFSPHLKRLILPIILWRLRISFIELILLEDR